MLVLSVIPAGAHQDPSVILYQLYGLPGLHDFLSSNVDFSSLLHNVAAHARRAAGDTDITDFLLTDHLRA